MTNTSAIPVRRFTAKLIRLRRLSETGYELTLERKGLAFRAGQLVTLHGASLLEDRSYTICSGENDEHLNILFRHIPAGRLTPRLVALQPGAKVDFSGPYGEFTLRDTARKLVFVATGTGIAPCRAYLRTHRGLDLTLLHGVRSAQDLFYREEFSGIDYAPCVTSEPGPWFHGRVTACLRTRTIDPDAHFYLCGANEMFYDARDILEERGVAASSIFTEAYYYRTDA